MLLRKLGKGTIGKLIRLGLVTVVAVIAIELTLAPAIASFISSLPTPPTAELSTPSVPPENRPNAKLLIRFLFPFFEGRAKVKIGTHYGYIDKTGNMVIKPQFDDDFIFSEGLAAVTIGDKVGYIDNTGNMVIKPQFDHD